MYIQYYAYAENAQGKIEQLLVTREKLEKGSKPVSQIWTGITYKTIKNANDDIERLNCND